MLAKFIVSVRVATSRLVREPIPPGNLHALWLSVAGLSDAVIWRCKIKEAYRGFEGGIKFAKSRALALLEGGEVKANGPSKIHHGYRSIHRTCPLFVQSGHRPDQFQVTTPTQHENIQSTSYHVDLVL